MSSHRRSVCVDSGARAPRRGEDTTPYLWCVCEVAPLFGYRLDQGLIRPERPAIVAPMQFIGALLVWALIAAVMVGALIWATHGALWAFVIAMVAFIVCFARYGCMTH